MADAARVPTCACSAPVVLAQAGRTRAVDRRRGRRLRRIEIRLQQRMPAK
jgi:hypothetical protein